MASESSTSPVAVLADAHIGGPGGDGTDLIAELDGLDPREAPRLLLLGDLFQAWVSHRRFETETHRRVLDALSRAAQRGIRMDYIEGNRDFFVAEGPDASLFETVGTEIRFRAGDRDVLAVHGDGLNARDVQYRFWRWLSKSRLVRWSMMALPRRLAVALTEGTESRLSKTNFRHKQEIPEEAILAFAARRLRETGCDLLILGHFHEPRSWSLPEGEVRILDAWFRTRSLETVP